MEKSQTFQMRVDAEFIKALDDWRRHQVTQYSGIPSRAEVVRRAVKALIDGGMAKQEKPGIYRHELSAEDMSGDTVSIPPQQGT